LTQDTAEIPDPGLAPAAPFSDRHDLENWRECSQCGQISVLPRMRPELVADCPRCDHTLWRMRISPFEFPIACGLSGLLFYLYALVAPFLEISAYGRFQLARLETGPLQLTYQGFELVGVLVMAVTLVFPGLKLGLMLFTLIGLQPRGLAAAAEGRVSLVPADRPLGDDRCVSAGLPGRLYQADRDCLGPSGHRAVFADRPCGVDGGGGCGA